MTSKWVRLCIYPKDVQIITGKSERYSRSLIQKIKKELNKKDHHFLSVDEFCEYTGLDSQQVKSILKK